MDYGNVDDDNVSSMARVIEIAVVNVMCYPTENDNAVPAAYNCDTLDKA